jgi:transketolase
MQHTKFYSFTAHEKQHFTYQANNWFLQYPHSTVVVLGQYYKNKPCTPKQCRRKKKTEKRKKTKKSSKKTLQAIFKLAKNSQRGNADLKQRLNSGHEEKFFTRAKR